MSGGRCGAQASGLATATHKYGPLAESPLGVNRTRPDRWNDVDDPSPASSLWYPRHAHALIDALARSEEGWIVTRCAIAEATDRKTWIERKSSPCFSKGKHSLTRGGRPNTWHKLAAFFERALELDPKISERWSAWRLSIW